MAKTTPAKGKAKVKITSSGKKVMVRQVKLRGVVQG